MPTSDPVPQDVLGPLTRAAHFLVLTVDPGGEDDVRDLLGDLAGLVRALGFGRPEDGLSCVAGVGSAAWDRLFDGPRPAELHPFVELTGPRHHAVATPGDLLFHIRATGQDLCFGLAAQIMRRLRGSVTVRDEVQGFSYYDFRDLLGFVDGTENPTGPVADAAALVGAEDQDFAGGSYVIVQKYVHDLDGWNALSVEAQEQIIGRTKLTNVELDAPGSHLDLTTITEPDGTERKILRDNMPFGSPGQGEFGTYFIGYAKTPEVTEEMLRNMFLGREPSSHDRILDFSTAVTGTLFYAPTADFLDDPPPAPEAAGAEAASDSTPTVSGPVPVPVTVPADASLGIGDLKRSAPS
ncbi:Dyp-type peroxidase [Streptomyces sp. NPDC058001]|uniref:Dyp-type peroxidase n=1 Tax=Streptomyces sp. NPDC058001 TaxID=3346300 RepID=UPI0036F10612